MAGDALRYQLGVPTAATASQMFDELAYQRAVQVYLWGLPAAGMQAYRSANADAMGGTDVNKVGFLGGLMKSNIVHLTGNPDSMYIEYFVDTHDGPVVVEVPATLPGLIDDMWQRPVLDLIASVSPSGKYLIVPPGWDGEPPADHVVARPRTYLSWHLLRGAVEQTPDGSDTAAAVAEMRDKLKIYPLAGLTDPARRPALEFVNVSDLTIDRRPPEGLEYFRVLADLVRSEPPDQTDAFAMGLMRSIGIAPGEGFDPDQRMTEILTRAAETGRAMALSIAFHGNEPERWHWPGRHFAEAFMGGSPSFETAGHVNHDARTYFFYLACGTSNLMASTTPGQGQAYPWTTRDAAGELLDGAKNYQLHIPAHIPAAGYWSVTAYDTITRSQIRNGSDFSRISTYTKPAVNPDGTIDLYFGPNVPPEQEPNWIRTLPGHGWFILVRLYGPEQPYFDRTWTPDDIVELHPD